jgi:chemotaxis protein CheY-P-specific phosphatase CheC
MAEEMTNIISAPLSEAVTFFRNTTVIPSVARIVSLDEFKSLPVTDDALVLELKIGGKMSGAIYFLMEAETVKKLKRTLKMRERE